MFSAPAAGSYSLTNSSTRRPTGKRGGVFLKLEAAYKLLADKYRDLNKKRELNHLYLEALVEPDLDHGSIVEADLHAVGRASVADLRLDDRAAARVRECRRGGLVQVRPGERPVVVSTRRDRDARAAPDRGKRDRHPDDPPGPASRLSHRFLLRFDARTV